MSRRSPFPEALEGTGGGYQRTRTTPPSYFQGNEASCRVLEKAGFTLEGRLRKSVTKDGVTIDSFLYAIIKD